MTDQIKNIIFASPEELKRFTKKYAEQIAFKMDKTYIVRAQDAPYRQGLIVIPVERPAPSLGRLLRDCAEVGVVNGMDTVLFLGGVETLLVPATPQTCTGWRIARAKVYLTDESFALAPPDSRQVYRQQAYHRGMPTNLDYGNTRGPSWGSIEHALSAIADASRGVVAGKPEGAE